ncbi:ogr/Delta-like zinc finger family protein [Kluyvera ascorbata]|uniref:ogr/Delta-like zinc finger family protein n=1 Tax=Kluyvera ascorbata TaxID=51288 RepID=UPI0029048DDB|nr:ogr/Delta-like zinc finger family protein [Kluyvera ascorbata]MDU1198837.1 ogr/Delta-like zinc finger family protein [Kluyvera ascorbata]
MFRCPHCGAMAHTRTSKHLNEEKTIYRQYHQCQNMECGLSFTTLNSVEKIVTKRERCEELSPDFIPAGVLPASHYGRDQLNLAI